MVKDNYFRDIAGNRCAGEYILHWDFLDYKSPVNFAIKHINLKLTISNRSNHSSIFKIINQ